MPHRMERLHRRLGRPVLVGAAVALFLGFGGGSAWAYFAATAGSATGAGRVGHAESLIVVDATGAPTTKLQPGGTAGLLLKLKNPNDTPVTITSITEGAGRLEVELGDRREGGTNRFKKNDCTPSNAGVSVNSETGLDITVAPGFHTVSVTGAAHMATSSSDACQGAVFHLSVRVTVKS